MRRPVLPTLAATLALGLATLGLGALGPGASAVAVSGAAPSTGAAAGHAGPVDGAAPSPPSPRLAPRDAEAERARIRRHLSEVEAALRRADVAHLDAPRRAARARVLDWLAEYREAGVFPHNHTHPDGRVPVFVDAHGTACAVGHLLLRSGEGALVRAVAEADNNVRVPALRDDAPFRAWLDAHGLTLAEAAWIQPTYGHRDEAEPRGYEHATVALAVASAGATAWGLGAARGASTDWPGIVALGVGLVDGVAAVQGAADEEPGWAVALNVAGAVVTGAVGLRRLFGGAGGGDVAEASRALTVLPSASAAGVGLTVRWRR